MALHIHYNSAFKDMSKEQIEQYCVINEYRLIGSAVFVRNKSFMSKLISRICGGKYKDKAFVPSHVGSLILCGGHIYLFDMKPPKTKDEFMLVMRNFSIDTEQFSLGIIKRINNKYGYLSAIQSAFKYLWWGFREHCSEIHLKELQAQGLFKEYSANQTTPEDLKNILLNYEGNSTND